MAVPGLTWLATGAEAAGLVFLQAPQNRLQRMIGPIKVNVAVEEEHVDAIEITSHPVETGVPMSDHAYALQREVTIHAAWSDSPGVFDTSLVNIPADILTGLGRTFAPFSSPEAKSVVDTYHDLVKLQRSFALLEIVTGKERYSNMLIERIQVLTDRTSEHALMVTAVCKEVILVSSNIIQMKTTPTNQGIGTTTPNADAAAAKDASTGAAAGGAAGAPGTGGSGATSAPTEQGGITYNPDNQNFDFGGDADPINNTGVGSPGNMASPADTAAPVSNGTISASSQGPIGTNGGNSVEAQGLHLDVIPGFIHDVPNVAPF